MADMIVDGRTAVWFVPVIASATLAPTVAEITAGTKISPYLIPAGLAGFDPSQGEIDNSSLETDIDTKLPGRDTFSGTQLVFKKQNDTPPFMTALGTKFTAGFVVVRDGMVASAAAAAAQKVDVFTITTGRAFTQGRGEQNSLLRWVVPTPISGAVARDVAILAGT